MIRIAPACGASWLVRALLVPACTLLFAAAAAAADKPLTEDDVARHIESLISERSKDGVFSLYDPKSGRDLALVFDRIRVVRGLTGYGWFPDVVFHAKDEPKKQYTVDFWLQPSADGLKLMDARVHKDAVPDGSSWMMITRSPLLWWWLPTIKRASAITGLQAWQVMGRVHEHIIAAQQGGAYALSLGDKSVPAELVAIYPPVARTPENHRYLSCVELREIGASNGSYAVAFELDPEANSVSAGTARPFEIPHAGSSNAAPASPCAFDASALDVVE